MGHWTKYMYEAHFMRLEKKTPIIKNMHQTIVRNLFSLKKAPGKKLGLYYFGYFQKRLTYL